MRRSKCERGPNSTSMLLLGSLQRVVSWRAAPPGACATPSSNQAVPFLKEGPLVSRFRVAARLGESVSRGVLATPREGLVHAGQVDVHRDSALFLVVPVHARQTDDALSLSLSLS